MEYSKVSNSPHLRSSPDIQDSAAKWSSVSCEHIQCTLFDDLQIWSGPRYSAGFVFQAPSTSPRCRLRLLSASTWKQLPAPTHLPTIIKVGQDGAIRAYIPSATRSEHSDHRPTSRHPAQRRTRRAHTPKPHTRPQRAPHDRTAHLRLLLPIPASYSEEPLAPPRPQLERHWLADPGIGRQGRVQYGRMGR